MIGEKGLRVGIVNPLTLIGAELKTLLNERGLPYAAIELFDSTGENSGTLTELNDGAAVIQALNENSLIGFELVFFCGASDSVLPWIHRAYDDGFIAIDLTHAVDDELLPVVAGVNDHMLQDDLHMISSAHPMAVPVALVLHQIARISQIELATVTVIQPASVFDQKGIDEMFAQTVAALNLKSVPKEIFDRQAAFNFYPAVDALVNERAAASDVRQLLDFRVPLSFSVMQGTAFHGHTFAMFVQTKEQISEPQLRSALASEPAIALYEADDDFTTIDAAGRDEVLVGRIEKDLLIPRAFWIWMACDNLRRGSALNAVLIAEEILSRHGQQPN